MRRISIIIAFLLISAIVHAENLSDYFLSSWKDQNAYRPYPILFVHGIAGHSNMWGGPKPPDNKGSILELKKYFKPYWNYEEANDDGSYPKVQLSPDKEGVPNRWFETYKRTYLETIEFSDNNMHPVDEAKELAYRIFGPVSWVPSKWSKPLDITQTDFKPVLQEYYSDSPSQWKPSDKIILICHSMGGLTSRDYIAHLSKDKNFDSHVSKLITISTPHWGSRWATQFMGVRNFFNKNTSPGWSRENSYRLLEQYSSLGGLNVEKHRFIEKQIAADELLEIVDTVVRMDTREPGIRATDTIYNLHPHKDKAYSDLYDIEEGESYVVWLNKRYKMPSNVSFWSITGKFDGKLSNHSDWIMNPVARFFFDGLIMKRLNFVYGNNESTEDMEEMTDGDGIVTCTSQRYVKGEEFPVIANHGIHLLGEVDQPKKIQMERSAFHTRSLPGVEATYDRWEEILQTLDDTMEMKVVTPDPDRLENLATKDLYCAVKFGDYLPADVVMKVYVDGVDRTSFLQGAEVAPRPIDGRETTITENGKYNSGFSFTLHNLEHGQRYITIELTNAAKLANPAKDEAGIRIEKSFYVTVPDVTIAQLKYEDA